MYTIVVSKKFKKQLRNIIKSGSGDLEQLEKVINLLRIGKKLPKQHRDHQLKGKLKDFRECHIESDWLLIYRQHEDLLILELIATGSHAQLFD